MSGLVLVFTIGAAMAFGIACGFVVLNLFFSLMSRNRRAEAPLAKPVVAH